MSYNHLRIHEKKWETWSFHNAFFVIVDINIMSFLTTLRGRFYVAIGIYFSSRFLFVFDWPRHVSNLSRRLEKLRKNRQNPSRNLLSSEKREQMETARGCVIHWTRRVRTEMFEYEMIFVSHFLMQNYARFDGKMSFHCQATKTDCSGMIKIHKLSLFAERL